MSRTRLSPRVLNFYSILISFISFMTESLAYFLSPCPCFLYVNFGYFHITQTGGLRDSLKKKKKLKESKYSKRKKRTLAIQNEGMSLWKPLTVSCPSLHYIAEFCFSNSEDQNSPDQKNIVPDEDLKTPDNFSKFLDIISWYESFWIEV